MSAKSVFEGCYARHLGNCTHKTREHFISKGVLQTIGAPRVTGFPWLQAGEVRAVSIESLSAAVLCDHHNSTLTAYDVEANRLIEHLKLLDGCDTPEKLEAASSIEIDGLKLERWLLKALCGITASGNFLIQGRSYGKITPSKYLVDLLYTDKQWPAGIGLHFATRNQTHLSAYVGIGYDPVIAQSGAHAEICGIDVEFWGFPLRALFGTPADMDLTTYRPRKLTIANGPISKDIDFIWPSDSVTSNGPVFRRTGTNFDDPFAAS